MLRFLYIWIYFEILNFLSFICGPNYYKRIQYFAFGANLDSKVLIQRRCIIPKTQKALALKDHQFGFTHQGPWHDFGFANIIKIPGETVYGYLYDISTIDAKRLDVFEGVMLHNGYKRNYLQQDGEHLYVYIDDNPNLNLRPLRYYKASILSGLSNDQNIPKDYIEAIKQIPLSEAKEMVACKTIFVKTFDFYPAWFKKIMWGLDGKLTNFFIFYVMNYSPWMYLIKLRAKIWSSKNN